MPFPIQNRPSPIGPLPFANVLDLAPRTHSATQLGGELWERGELAGGSALPASLAVQEEDQEGRAQHLLREPLWDSPGQLLSSHTASQP